MMQINKLVTLDLIALASLSLTACKPKPVDEDMKDLSGMPSGEGI